MEIKQIEKDLFAIYEKIFRNYYERCHGRELQELDNQQKLLLMQVGSTKDLLRTLYCHLN